MTTICVNCQYHHGKPDGPRSSVWYNQFCMCPAVKLPAAVDPVTGVTPQGLDLRPNCRDINRGDCQHFSHLIDALV